MASRRMRPNILQHHSSMGACRQPCLSCLQTNFVRRSAKLGPNNTADRQHSSSNPACTKHQARRPFLGPSRISQNTKTNFLQAMPHIVGNKLPTTTARECATLGLGVLNVHPQETGVFMLNITHQRLQLLPPFPPEHHSLLRVRVKSFANSCQTPRSHRSLFARTTKPMTASTSATTTQTNQKRGALNTAYPAFPDRMAKVHIGTEQGPGTPPLGAAARARNTAQPASPPVPTP